jgi:phosphatidate cytidylyltransferase
VKQRVITAVLLIPPVLLAVFVSGSWWLYLLALIAFGIGYFELSKLAMGRLSTPVVGGIVMLAWLAIPYERADFGGDFLQVRTEFAALCFALSLVGAAGSLAIARGVRGYWIAEVATLWVAAPLLAMVNLKAKSFGAAPFWDWGTPVLLCLIPLWIGDSLAIFAGRAYGKRLLAPAISPKKTVEGALANLLGCILGAVAVELLIRQPWYVGVLAGVATGTLGQAGDLLESAMKRSAGVKDSGNLLPGHGGLLDRIDSILLSAPAVALIVVALGTVR